MKWSKELDEKLKNIVSEGKRYEEIATLLNTTICSIRCRMNRLGLKIIFYKDCSCKNCKEIFNARINDNRQFCSHKCSAEYNNKNRKHTEESKNKISISLLKYNDKIGKGKKHIKERKEKIKNIKNEVEKTKSPRKCKNCEENKITKKFVQFCDDCKIEYYKYYRPLCEFSFFIGKYLNEFNMVIVEEYGWYSPTNKGNNLNGVSRDHMYSVKDGFINNINPYYIKHPANCQLLIHYENNTKNTKSIITLEELYNRIENWNNKYGCVSD